MRIEDVIEDFGFLVGYGLLDGNLGRAVDAKERMHGFAGGSDAEDRYVGVEGVVWG